MSLYNEFRRCNVLQADAAYIVLVCLTVQIVLTVLSMFGIDGIATGLHVFGPSG